MKQLMRRAGYAVTLATMFLVAGAPAASAAPGDGGGGKFSNPFDSISPDLSILGPAFNSKWTRLGSAVWAVSFLVVTVKLIASFMKMKSAEKRGYAQEVTEYTGEVKVAGIAFAGLLLLGVFVGSIIFVVQPGA